MSTRRRTTTTTTRIEVSSDRGVFMISVAAELADMHPQTLRMYEQRGLIEPKRSPKGTRLYSHEDVERLRRIQQMTAELGLNLAGVEKVLELEAAARAHAPARRRARAPPRRSSRPRSRRSRASARQVRADIVRYEGAKGSELVRVEGRQALHDPDRAPLSQIGRELVRRPADADSRPVPGQRPLTSSQHDGQAPDDGISVVIPVLDDRAGLARTLQALGDQRRCPDEVIVVDGGSRDGTAALARDWDDPRLRVRVICEPGSSIGAARNAGVRVAGHRWVACTERSLLTATGLAGGDRRAPRACRLRRGGYHGVGREHATACGGAHPLCGDR